MKISGGTALSFIFILFLFTTVVFALEEQINEPLLQKTRDLLNDKRYSEVISLLAEHAPEPHSASHYHFIYGMALSGTNKHLQAADHLRKAYTLLQKREFKEIALLESGNSYNRMRYFYEAQSAFRIFIKNFPDSPHTAKAYLGIAKSTEGIGKLREALEYYNKAEDIPDALFGKANILHRLGMIKDAGEFYIRAILRDNSYLPRNPDALYYYAENLRARGKFEEARKNLSSIREPLFRGKAEISLGLIALESGKVDAASKHFKTAMSFPEINVKRQALLNLAVIQEQSGKINEAMAVYEEIRNKYPYGRDYDEALLRLSRVYRKSERFNDAVSVLKELVFRMSPMKEAIDEFEAIIHHVKTKDREQFLALWKSVSPWLLDSSREKFLLQMSDALRGTGRPFFDLHRFLAKHGSEEGKVKGLSTLARFYADMGDNATAEEYLRRVRPFKKSGDEVLRIEARMLYAKKDLKGTVEKILALKRFENSDVELLGNTITSARDIKKAMAIYEKIIKETGAGAASYVKLADIYYEMGDRKNAGEYYRAAIKKEPDNQWALYRVGLLAEDEESVEIFKKAERGKSPLTKFTGAILKEIEIKRKLKEKF